MKTLFFILFFLSYFCTTAGTIQFKFRLYNKKDSSLIALKQVQLTPVASYLVKEWESHDDAETLSNFNSHKIYYDSINQVNVFEYDTASYNFREAFLKVVSDSFFYSRPFAHDYDEADHIMFKTVNKDIIQDVYLCPITFIQVFTDDIQKPSDCLNIQLQVIYKNDTHFVSPSYSKPLPSPKTKSLLIKTFAIPENNHSYLLLIEVYNKHRFQYTYYPIKFSQENTLAVYLKDLVFSDWPNEYKKSSFHSFSYYRKNNSLIEFYLISDL
jgi:hypothetical protein